MGKANPLLEKFQPSTGPGASKMCLSAKAHGEVEKTAPLLAPCVLGAPSDEFMFHRVLALHTHMCLYIRRRARAPSSVGQGKGPGKP